MQNLIQIEAGKPVGNPINQHQFRRLFPNVSFTNPLESEDVVSRGYALFQDKLSPEPGRYEVIKETTPVQVSDDLWERGWSAISMTAEEKASVDSLQAEISRVDRTGRLLACDWTLTSDSPLSESQKAACIEYRQKLRDVPNQSGFPWEVVWPELPV